MSFHSDYQFQLQSKKNSGAPLNERLIESFYRSITSPQNPEIIFEISKNNLDDSMDNSFDNQIKQKYINKALSTINRIQIKSSNSKNGTLNQFNQSQIDSNNFTSQIYKQAKLVGVDDSSSNNISEPAQQSFLIQNYQNDEVSLDLSNNEIKENSLSNIIMNEESFLSNNVPETQKKHKILKILEARKEENNIQQNQNIIQSNNYLLSDQTLQFDLNNIKTYLNPIINNNNQQQHIYNSVIQGWSQREDNQKSNVNSNENSQNKKLNTQKKETTCSSVDDQKIDISLNNIQVKQLSNINSLQILNLSGDNQSKVKQMNFQSDSSGSSNSRSSSSNNFNEEKKNELQYFCKERQVHLLEHIPIYFKKEQTKQCKIKTFNFKNKTQNCKKILEIDDFDQEDEQQQYLNLSSSISQNSGLFQIKIDISSFEDQDNIIITLEQFDNLSINSQIFDCNSTNIPIFNFSDIDLIQDQNSCKFDNLQNIFQLRDTQNKKKYQFLRFQSYEECCLIFQDILLTNLIFDRIQVPSVIQKNIYFYKHAQNDFYLLREVDDFITVDDLIQYTGQVQLGFNLFNEEQTLCLLLEILKVYNVFINEQIAIPNLSSSTIIINYYNLAISFSSLQSCYSVLNKDQYVVNQMRQTEREQIMKIFQRLSEKIFRDKLSPFRTMIYENESLDENKCIQFQEQLFKNIILGNIEQAIADIQVRISEIINQNQDDELFNNSQTDLEQSLLNTNGYLNSENSKLIYHLKKKRLHLLNFINILDSKINQKNDLKKHSKFYKCQKLTYLYQIYESIFMKKEYLKTLEELKNLKAVYYGEVSKEYLQTFSILCKAYYTQEQHKSLLLNIEPYTNYLRNNLNNSNANNLFEMIKFKLKMTNTPTVREDIQTLINFLISKQKIKDKNIQILPYLSTPQNSSQKSEKLLFNLSILYYQFGCSYKYFENNDQAMEYFQLCIKQLQQETDRSEKDKAKLYFYCQSNIARIHFRNKKINEAQKILKSLEQKSPRYLYPPFLQYLGIIEYEQNNFELAHEYLNQCYILRQNNQKCNRDYLELIFYYILTTFKLFGRQSKDFKRLCQEIKNFTGDYYNLDCLLVITKILLQQQLLELALKKFEQAKGIMNLLLITQNKNKTLFGSYKKRFQNLEKLIEKIQNERRSERKISMVL